jgi:hypothetical protein
MELKWIILLPIFSSPPSYPILCSSLSPSASPLPRPLAGMSWRHSTVCVTWSVVITRRRSFPPLCVTSAHSPHCNEAGYCFLSKTWTPQPQLDGMEMEPTVDIIEQPASSTGLTWYWKSIPYGPSPLSWQLNAISDQYIISEYNLEFLHTRRKTPGCCVRVRILFLSFFPAPCFTVFVSVKLP